MTEQQLTAMEQALEALERYVKEDEVAEGMPGNEPWIETKRMGETSITALRQALAAEQKPAEGRDWSLLEATQESLREHMAEIKRLRGLLEQQPADEPVAYMSRNSHGGYSFSLSPQFFDNPEPLYTRPAERKFEETSHQPADDGWLQAGGLLYRLTKDRRPENRDEINVTMADGSRSIESCTRRASELLDRIRATSPQPAAWVGLTEWEVIEMKAAIKGTLDVQFIDFARAIEAKLREKNGGGK